MWHYDGSIRPDFAEISRDGQESVWDFPRPPRVDSLHIQVEVLHEGEVLAEWDKPIRISETASPPVFYLPFGSLESSLLCVANGRSVCEWKGTATYWRLKKGAKTPVAWSYEHPMPGYLDIKNHMAFYPGRVSCFVGGEKVRPQPGGFYGGWLTSNICGPVKGLPGTESW